MSETSHEHSFSFLRQEETPSKRWGEHVLEWLVQDVFFCSGCLETVRKDVRRETLSRTHFGRDVIWRAADAQA